ncbi:GNAT family N-acetyltransferase [Streptomyces xiamenensis]
MTDLVFRCLAEGESSTLFTSLPDAGLVGRALLDPPHNVVRTIAEGGEYRPEWVWMALRDGEVVARAAYWGGPDDTKPVALDWFDFTDPEAGTALLRASGLRPEYELILPPGWRSDPLARAAGGARISAAVEAGYEPLVERFRYTWTPECGIPDAPGRLVFRPEPDDDVVLDIVRRIHSTTLDAHALRAMAQDGPDAAARQELEFLNWCPSPREWWRVAYTPEGEPVGFQAPARNPNGPVVGLIGVVPEQRGHGYAYDLLVECTRQLAAEGAERIHAATDTGNVPMAKAFARAGYPVTQHRYCLA